MREECRELFVYGSLRRGSRNEAARMLGTRASFMGPARIRGRLYSRGKYSGMVLSGNPDEWVHGEIFTLLDVSATLALLDDYEGCGKNDTPPLAYERVLGGAVLENGDEVLSWAYVYKGATKEEDRIASGRWQVPGESGSD